MVMTVPIKSETTNFPFSLKTEEKAQMEMTSRKEAHIMLTNMITVTNMTLSHVA